MVFFIEILNTLTKYLVLLWVEKWLTLDLVSIHLAKRSSCNLIFTFLSDYFNIRYTFLYDVCVFKLTLAPDSSSQTSSRIICLSSWNSDFYLCELFYVDNIFLIFMKVIHIHYKIKSVQKCIQLKMKVSTITTFQKKVYFEYILPYIFLCIHELAYTYVSFLTK